MSRAATLTSVHLQLYDQIPRRYSYMMRKKFWHTWPLLCSFKYEQTCHWKCPNWKRTDQCQLNTICGPNTDIEASTSASKILGNDDAFWIKMPLLSWLVVPKLWPYVRSAWDVVLSETLLTICCIYFSSTHPDLFTADKICWFSDPKRRMVFHHGI